jgi:hypothetical protein
MEAQVASNRTKLNKNDEADFQAKYAEYSKKTGIHPNPDDPNHKYDYRGAYKEGLWAGPDKHWPSKFKDDDHPNRWTEDMDTKTGKSIWDID